ncbi:MAG: branched-chain amino acid ABC transporter permease [Coriobacteriia bacterium]|nr:branched-chain amino acid ABC transporter permease [Coriobacteriia bacterium]
MINTTHTSNDTTQKHEDQTDFEDQAVKGTPTSAEKIFGKAAKPLFGRGKSSSKLKTSLTALLVVFVLLMPIYLQGMGESLLLSASVFVGLYLLLALGLNIIIGYAGMLDFGRMAFYAVGAYTAMMLALPLAGLMGDTLKQFAFPFIVVASGISAGFVGWLLSLPVMRLRGDYLAIVTLAFGEIVRITLMNDPFGLTNGMVGLPRGGQLPPPPFFEWLRENVYWVVGNDFIFSVTRNVYWYYMVFIVLIFAIIVIRRQDHSRLGRSWAAMREDEVAATAMGVNVTKAKTWAFVLGAFWGGAAGACFGFFMGSVTPETFNFFNSVVVLAIVVIGGMGSIPGVLLGGVLIMGFPELVRWFAMNHLGQAGGEIQSLVANLRNLLLGLFMVVMMTVRTAGLIPMKPKIYKLYGKGDSDKADVADEAVAVGAAPEGGAG